MGVREILKSIGSIGAAFLRSCPKIAAQRTLYPEAPRKNLIRRYLENLYLRFRDGAVCLEYTAAGLDLKAQSISNYITEGFRVRYIEPDAVKSLATRAAVLFDKELFEIYFTRFDIPVIKTLGRFVYDNDAAAFAIISKILKKENQVFLKRVTGWCGEKCWRLESESERLKEIKLEKGETYIIQPSIENHAAVAKLNPSSLNTLRLVTYIDPTDGVPHKWDNGFIRAGGPGSDVDNFWAGGVAIPFNPDGTLKRYGFTKSQRPGELMRIEKHPGSGVAYLGYEIPYYREALELCLKAHSYLHLVKSIGWDVAITPSGPVIVEGNHDWGNDIVQVVKATGDMNLYKTAYGNKTGQGHQ